MKEVSVWQGDVRFKGTVAKAGYVALLDLRKHQRAWWLSCYMRDGRSSAASPIPARQADWLRRMARGARDRRGELVPEPHYDCYFDPSTWKKNEGGVILRTTKQPKAVYVTVILDMEGRRMKEDRPIGIRLGP